MRYSSWGFVFLSAIYCRRSW